MSDVTSMLDRLAILELISRFAHYFDEGQLNDWANLFTEDGAIEFRRLNKVEVAVRIQGREQIKASGETRGRDLGSKKLRHQQLNPLIIELGENYAVARTYITVLSIDTPKTLPRLIFSGVYQDELVKQDGQWLFKQRTTFPDSIIHD